MSQKNFRTSFGAFVLAPRGTCPLPPTRRYWLTERGAGVTEIRVSTEWILCRAGAPVVATLSDIKVIRKNTLLKKQ